MKDKRKQAKQGIVIDIDGVSPQTRIGDLTVAQFVSLLVQVSGQTRPVSPPPDAEAFRKALKEVEKAISAEGEPSEPPVKVVREFQKLILERMPGLIEEAGLTRPR